MNISKKCSHPNHIKLTLKSSFCPTCFSLLFHSIDNKGQDRQILLISSMKTQNYNYLKEVLSLNSFQGEEKNRICYSFINKKEYLKHRKSIIKNMKKVISHFKLSNQTYFLSIEYFDCISSIMTSFNNDTLCQISTFCIILAAKFNEVASKTFEILSFLKKNLPKNFLIDEIYTLKLLNYDLKKYTAFDILSDILNCGFVFDDENFNPKKFEYMHNELIKILYIFSENNSFIDLTPKQIAIGIIGLGRELLKLEPFNERIIEIYNLEENFIFGFETIKKFFKVNNSTKIEKNKELIDNAKSYNQNIYVRTSKNILE